VVIMVVEVTEDDEVSSHGNQHRGGRASFCNVWVCIRNFH